MHQYATLTAQKLGEEISSSSILTEFFESIQLVTGNVSGLFINRSISSLVYKLTKCQDLQTKIRKQIVSKSQCLDGDKLIELLEGTPSDQLNEIECEFLATTAKKFAKSQPIEKYARFLQILVKTFGFDEQFLKYFLFTDRDSTEILFLLNYISQWNLPKTQEYMHQSAIYFLEKIIIRGSLEDFNELFEQSFEMIEKHNLNDTLFHLLYQVLNFTLQKDYAPKIIENAYQIFDKKGFHLDLNQTNLILELITKNFKEEEFLNIFMKIADKNSISFDITSYNFMIEIYCNQSKFSKALEIFHQLSDNNSPNSTTYSNLIKGLKNCDQDKSQNALSLFLEYKSKQMKKEIIVYNSLIYLFLGERQSDKVDEIFQEIIMDGLTPDETTFNTIIKGSCKNKDIDQAYKYFQKMKNFHQKPNRITYNSLMDLAVKIERMNIALQLIEQMHQDDITPDSYTYSIILNGLKLNNSSQNLVKMCLDNIRKVINANELQLDQVLFNSLFDVAAKYNLVNEAEEFYQLMKNKGIKDSPYTCTVMIQIYTQANRFNEAIQLFKRMIKSGIKIKEASYGLVLECCTKNKKMNLVVEMYESMKDHYFNMNSIVFTTIIKGYLKSQDYNQAIEFFKSIKQHNKLPGMIITYNCALDIYAHNKDMDSAIALFEEIEQNFGADLISYSTIIKALTCNDRKVVALEYLKKMIKSKIVLDVSVINLFLENCATKEDYKLSLEGYKFAMMLNIEPNEITFGIMVKVHGFARDLQAAFDLLDLMNVYQIKPSIIIFTNLIHISYYCREPRKAELAYSLFRKHNLDGDELLYSKLIDGLIRFRQIKKVPKYVRYCQEEKCCLKEKTIKSILKYFDTKEMREQLEQIKSYSSIKKQPHKNVHTFVNTFNLDNPKRFKKQIREQRIQIQNSNTSKIGNDEDEAKTMPNNYNRQQKPMALHNFRRNKN